MILVYWRYDLTCIWAKEAYPDSKHEAALNWFKEKKANNNDVDLILLDHDHGDGEILELVVLNQHRRIEETTG